MRPDPAKTVNGETSPFIKLSRVEIQTAAGVQTKASGISPDFGNEKLIYKWHRILQGSRAYPRDSLRVEKLCILPVWNARVREMLIYVL